jgi:tetratricopeptide (TPR) repeat protein
MDSSKAQKLWFLLNKIDRFDQSDLSQDKVAFPYFYLLQWNERFSVLKQQRIALLSTQRKQYFQSVYDIEEESQELVISKPAEEIKALQDSIIDQFIQNQPSLSKPKKSGEDDEPIEDLAAVEFSLPVSETIAILLTKQGKYLQAIELYEKLSLIKPEKRVYFASRIEELQKILYVYIIDFIDYYLFCSISSAYFSTKSQRWWN